MSKQNLEPGQKTPAPATLDDRKQVSGAKRPLQSVEVVSLEIDENDYGTDPYNRTGSFCVKDFEEE